MARADGGSSAAQPPSIVLAAVTPVKQERQLSMPQATRTSITARRAPPVVREFTVMRWSEARRRCIRAHDEPPSLRCDEPSLTSLQIYRPLVDPSGATKT